MFGRASLPAIPLLVATVALAQSSLPEIWTSKTSSINYRLTMKKQTLRAEKIFPIEFSSQVAQGAFVRCDYAQQAGAWLGKCESHLPFEAHSGRVKWCKIKFTSRITLFSPARIEGESDVWENSDVDVEKCQVTKSHAQHFLWLPKS